MRLLRRRNIKNRRKNARIEFRKKTQLLLRKMREKLEERQKPPIHRQGKVNPQTLPFQL